MKKNVELKDKSQKINEGKKVRLTFEEELNGRKEKFNNSILIIIK